MNQDSQTAPPATRIAVVAVHGVADQKAGDTVRAIAGLLVNSGAFDARYGTGEVDSFLLQVPPLAPAAGDVAQSATPDKRPIVKGLHQSLRSDFQRDDWVAPDRLGVAARQASNPADAGVAFSDYLLYKAQRNGAQNEPCEVHRVSLTRTGAAHVRQVDVYEMHWADLSRLAGVIPRIVTELFTMVFRLSRLGRDTVDQASRAAEASPGHWWRWLAWSQIALDWGFAIILANLFLQLLLAGCILAAMGAAAPYANALAKGIAVAVPLLAFLWSCYRFELAVALRVLAAAAAAVLGYSLAQMPSPWLVGLVWLGLLTLAADRLLRVADARFPMTRLAGMSMWAVVAASVIFWAATEGVPADLNMWVRAAMRAAEYLLRAVVLWWALAGLFLLAWLFLGQRAASDGAFGARAAVATGRLGLFGSIAAFLSLTMALWALLTPLLELGAAHTDYAPAIFTRSESPADIVAAAPPWCRLAAYTSAIEAGPGPAPGSGAAFLDQRYRHSTETFSLVAVLALLLLSYVLAVLLPSVLAEVRARVGTARRLGRWLTVGLRALDRVATAIIVLSVLGACVVAAFLLWGVPGERWPREAASCVAIVSWVALKPLVISAAGLLAVLSALGGVLSRYVPWLRAPLDIALDVDNYFREFPRKAIARARIFSRYAALLEHIAAKEYQRVVIVAHSQGTVISAELLRYLQHRGAAVAPDAGTADRAANLWRFLDKKVHLLTAGCPLRQLYAARFPDRYDWVLDEHKGRVGPLAGDVGACRWINAYTTGDYVGRWLWSDPPEAPGMPPSTVDTLAGSDLYAVTAPQDLASKIRDAAELDVCLGSGAHTHYFEADQKVVAQLVDSLVST
jgi:hypothetical protein